MTYPIQKKITILDCVNKIINEIKKVKINLLFETGFKRRYNIKGIYISIEVLDNPDDLTTLDETDSIDL